MSSVEQVNNDYFYYVCAYIINNNAADESILLDGSGLFSLSDIGQGIQISSWNLANLTQPTMNILRAILPSRITIMKRTWNAYQVHSELKRLSPILKDIYNRINLLPNTHTYDSDAAFIAYLRTLY
jgi:hypothetical protein